MFIDHEVKKINPLALLKLWQIIGCKKRGITALLPVSRSTFLNRVSNGTYPPPVKLGMRSVAWKASEILELLENISRANEV